MCKKGALAVSTTHYMQAFCYSTALHHGWEAVTEFGRQEEPCSCPYGKLLNDFRYPHQSSLDCDSGSRLPDTCWTRKAHKGHSQRRSLYPKMGAVVAESNCQPDQETAVGSRQHQHHLHTDRNCLHAVQLRFHCPARGPKLMSAHIATLRDWCRSTVVS